MLTHRRDNGNAHYAAGPTTVMTATSEKPGHAAMNGHGDAAVADGGGAISRVGSYCFWFVDQRWEWSDEVSGCTAMSRARSCRQLSWCFRTNILMIERLCRTFSTGRCIPARRFPVGTGCTTPPATSTP